MITGDSLCTAQYVVTEPWKKRVTLDFSALIMISAEGFFFCVKSQMIAPTWWLLSPLLRSIVNFTIAPAEEARYSKELCRKLLDAASCKHAQTSQTLFGSYMPGMANISHCEISNACRVPHHLQELLSASRRIECSEVSSNGR